MQSESYAVWTVVVWVLPQSTAIFVDQEVNKGANRVIILCTHFGSPQAKGILKQV